MDAERPDPPARRAGSQELPDRPVSPFARDEGGHAHEPPERAVSRSNPGNPGNPGDWSIVRDAAAACRRQVKMVVEEASLVEFKNDCVTLRVATDLMTAATGVQEDIRQLIARAWGRSVRLEFFQPANAATLPGSSAASHMLAGTGAGGVAAARASSPADALQPAQTLAPEQSNALTPALTVANATDNPLIARAVELFGAKVLGVYPRNK